MPELVGELVEPAADVPALPGMVLLLAALLPWVTLAPPVAPAAAPLDPLAEPPAAAPPPAPAASAMLLPPRKAMVASKAKQCLVCGIRALLWFPACTSTRPRARWFRLRTQRPAIVPRCFHKPGATSIHGSIRPAEIFSSHMC